MSAKESAPKIALPKGWSDNIKSAVLHVISLAQFGTAYTRGWAANSIHSHIRLQAECERLEQQVAQLTEEIRIKDARMGQLDPRNRPHYPATERIAILLLRASHGWSLKQTAKRFLVTPATIASWVKRVDEQRPKALVQLREPVNKFPDFVRYAVQRLKAARPSMGKVKIVQMLCRAGLARYVEWYNEWRPHTFLRGRTPNEAYHRRHPACRYPRFEPRSRWPRGAPCAAPRVPARGKSGVRLNLDVAYHAEQRHLPIVKLRRVA
jgi:transcriptional regulator with XRE-family HTH domain